MDRGQASLELMLMLATFIIILTLMLGSLFKVADSARSMDKKSSAIANAQSCALTASSLSANLDSKTIAELQGCKCSGTKMLSDFNGSYVSSAIIGNVKIEQRGKAFELVVNGSHYR